MSQAKRRLLIRTNTGKIGSALDGLPGKIQPPFRVTSLGGFLVTATPRQETWLRRTLGRDAVRVDGVVVPVPFLRRGQSRPGATRGPTTLLLAPDVFAPAGLLPRPNADTRKRVLAVASDSDGAQLQAGPIRVVLFDNGIAEKSLFGSALRAFDSSGSQTSANVQDHPTLAASIILQGDPEATVLSVDVATSPALLCEAMAWATSKKARYKIRVFCVPAEIDGSELIDEVNAAVSNAREAGILVCAAAGNGGSIGPPASAGKAMAVGAYSAGLLSKEGDEVPYGSTTPDTDPSTKPDIYRSYGPYETIDALGAPLKLYGTSGACASAAAVSSSLFRISPNANKIEERLRAKVNLTPAAVDAIALELNAIP